MEYDSSKDFSRCNYQFLVDNWFPYSVKILVDDLVDFSRWGLDFNHKLNLKFTLAKKMKFFIKDFFSVIKAAGNWGLGHTYWRNP